MANFKTAIVAGASGSGKTLIAKMFQRAYVHSMDNYFRPPFDKYDDGVPKWDEPNAVDMKQWIKDYHRVKEAIALKKKIKLSTYDFKTHEIGEYEFDGGECEDIEWLVLEGLFALAEPLLHLADIRVFVEAPFTVRVSRRLNRDMGERHNDLKLILSHSYYTELSYQKYILPQKEHADLVIPNYEVGIYNPD